MKAPSISILPISLPLLIISIFQSCSTIPINKSKGIEFFKTDTANKIAKQKLDVFSPKNNPTGNVLIFIHGGNWRSGNRSIYSFFGRGMAKNGITAVIIDYPLSPHATYKEMARVSAASVKWVKENISHYGGDPDKIFISGHSAGGHLAALISLDEEYFQKLNLSKPIAGTILIDAAGLDMYDYLKSDYPRFRKTYLKTFTNDSTEWKTASPVYFLDKQMPPFLVYQGGNTFPFIKEVNEEFMTKLLPLAPSTKYYSVEGKNHFGMIFQFLSKSNSRYAEITRFMLEHSTK